MASTLNFIFAILFFTELVQGRELDEALANATRKLPPRFASAELKTLKRWIAQALELDNEPTTTAEWRSALRSRFGDLLTLMNIVESFANPAVTSGAPCAVMTRVPTN